MKIKTLFIFAPVIVLTFSPGQSFAARPTDTKPTTAQTTAEFSKAQALYNKKQYEGAAQILDKMLAADANNAQAHYLFGNCFVVFQDYGAARYEYEAAKKIAPAGQLADFCNRALANLPGAPPPANQGATTANQAPTPAVKINNNAMQKMVVVPVGTRSIVVSDKLLEREEVRRLLDECRAQIEQKDKDLQERIGRIQAEKDANTTSSASFKEARAVYDKEIQQAKLDSSRQQELVQAFYSKKINSFWAAADMKRAYHQ